jgi:predicted PurR-regulated permease PerM
VKIQESNTEKSTMDNSFKAPFYVKLALVFIGIFSVVFTMYIGQRIIVPIVFATIIAILLNPVVNYLTAKKVNKLLAISISVLLFIIAIIGVLYVLSSQISMICDTYPQLKVKFNVTSTQIVQWVSQRFNIRTSKINEWISITQTQAVSNFIVGEKLTEAGQMLMTGVLLPVYLFMILFYKPLLLEFTRKLFKQEHHVTIIEVFASTKKIIQSYLIGLFFEMVIVATLNSVGLLILGIDYAIILGITGAILNVIPYIGGIIAIALPMSIAFVTKDSITYSILVFLVYIFIQFIDNHYIIPRIVASRVKLNALVSIIVVLVGGALWGIPGMFVSIPLTAIMKVIFDHIESLKPWGFLLGNVVPTASKYAFIRQRTKASPLIK